MTPEPTPVIGQDPEATSNAETSPPPVTPADKLPSVAILPGGREALKLFERELETYRRELPRLLVEEEEGRFALLQGEELLSTWDTWGDANQAGMEKLGLDGHFAIMQIDRRDIDKFAILDAYQRDSCQG